MTLTILIVTTEVESHRVMKYRRALSDVPSSVKNAWNLDYVGKTDKLLREAISSMYRKSSEKPYSNFCPIIQGSGTGKSRLVDKLAESVFTIPITLRPESDRKGFPIGDTAHESDALVDFFCEPRYSKSPPSHAQLLYLQFLLKVLALADKWIDEYRKSGRELENMAAEWKRYLGLPRTPNRSKMYGQAIDKSSLEGFENILNEKIEFNALQARVKTFVGAIAEKIKPTSDGEPSILFYFDEAQHLATFMVTMEQEEPRWTGYQCLCKALTYMLGTPVFTLFLSSDFQLSEFSTRARNFWSSHLLPSSSTSCDENLNPPFVELPFDVWKASSIVTEGSHSADEICSPAFMARFGRPMFWANFEWPYAKNDRIMDLAMWKFELRFEDPTRKQRSDYPSYELIPLLAARLDLTFKSDQDEAVYLEQVLVASGMRTVYSVPEHRQYLCGGYPSEPFLTEAASRKNIPEAICNWIWGGLIDEGSRGELVARMFCTLAHDFSILKKLSIDDIRFLSFSQMVPVVDFFHALIAPELVDKILDARPQNTEGRPLKEVFQDAYIHFTQFVKADNKPVISDEAAYLLFTRAAAIRSCGSLADVDLIIPVWIRGEGNPDRWMMCRKSITFSGGNGRRPYITIAMQLGLTVKNNNQDELVKVSPPLLEKQQGNERIYPRYEISINGCSNEVYDVIGSSKTYYDCYSRLLEDGGDMILSEHPRQGRFLDAVKRMKPCWMLGSYEGAMVKENSG
ncbi:hypothetical protein AGABI1DRAFT_131627 [Agaricus bisporus var. burnettii JB137-S8]|uniref:Uncharacterized protein n=1 Tax=Agaricus bisporus var. burnettii (strain JB137-S8 / ATCC MYA-4627 / FGSC 10392) TaxID=597362 RepID=K5WZT8_AGABU|nr:uncharacterized protein AGABI1DRAFT_131627 [Agaricus bisporus var. burnettii JB137-S8]EKM76112.1 hypothetical protein AGABI1DRAFT_131627 [Agaricus bisporus var. burnettii JB137-S8]